jgi:hypothetical protein
MAKKLSPEEKIKTKREAARKVALRKIRALEEDPGLCYSVACEGTAAFRVVEFRAPLHNDGTRGNLQAEEAAVSTAVSLQCAECITEHLGEVVEDLSGKSVVECEDAGPLLGFMVLPLKLTQELASEVGAEIAKEVCLLLNQHDE